MEIIILIIVAGIVIMFSLDNPIGAITILILGAIGYGLLGMISSSWAIFGAIIGGLLGMALLNKK